MDVSLLRRRINLGLVAFVAALATLLAALAPAARGESNYVALGDSFTAGPLIPLQIAPFGCFKSNNNYPHLLRDDFGLSLRDASCSGAETDDFWTSQNVTPDPDPPAQFERLDSDTQVVTVGIAGNDIGFPEIIRNCTSRTSPYGRPCQDRYLQGDTDVISQRIEETAPKIAAVLDEIHRRSPQADIYWVNYLPILPDKGKGCWPQVPIAYDDVPYLRDKHKELNDMLAEQVAEYHASTGDDARVVDAYRAGIRKDACQLPGKRWVEPAVPLAAAPYHPNFKGMKGTESRVRATALRRARRS